jgi:hypothetical protein
LSTLLSYYDLYNISIDNRTLLKTYVTADRKFRGRPPEYFSWTNKRQSLRIYVTNTSATDPIPMDVLSYLLAPDPGAWRSGPEEVSLGAVSPIGEKEARRVARVSGHHIFVIAGTAFTILFTTNPGYVLIG